jgi:hypothetical protein
MSKQWNRDNEALVDVFAIAGDRELTLETAQAWTDQQCQEAEEWAWALHFRASDNPHVKVPPMPAHVQALPSVLAAL